MQDNPTFIAQPSSNQVLASRRRNRYMTPQVNVNRYPIGARGQNTPGCGSFLLRIPMEPRHFEKAWYCVHTHAGKEFFANAHLRLQRFDTFLPTHLVSYKSKPPQRRPFFPHYMFVSFDIEVDRWQAILSTHGVRRLFSSAPEAPTIIEPEIFANFISIMNVDNNPTSGIVDIPKGTTVRITNGHFAGQEHICEWSDSKRVDLLIKIMNREVRVSFNREDIELIPEHTT